MNSNFEEFLQSILFKEKQSKDQKIIPYDQFNVDEKLQQSESFSLLDVNSFKNPLNNKLEKNKIYTKNYRLKKKQELQALKQENKFLKQKIDDLNFRLRQAQIQINKLKHQDLNFPANFNTIKEQCLKQIQKILSVQGAPCKQVYDLQKKFKSLVAFSNKPRLDLLNYLMSELLQNLVSDQGMYFIQCIQNKTGIYRQDQTIPLKRIDQQILQILNGLNSEISIEKNIVQNIFQESEKFIMIELAKIKGLWKKLYEDYINIINHGLKLEALYLPIIEKRKDENNDWILFSLKLRLHFQKNKYRKDIRQIRQSWFKQIQQGRKSEQKSVQKIIKKLKPQN